LADGSRTIGIFNRFDWPQVSFREFGLKGGVKGRDTWAAKDIGTLPNKSKARAPSHGVVPLRVSE
jgi:Alpha galactosidase C-terminal beta sandwich domain